MNERHGALPTAHGPNCASATYDGHSPPSGRHSQRRGRVPKLLWTDLFNFWLSLTLALSPEHRARMSEIKHVR